MKNYENITEYIQAYPKDVQVILHKVRKAIKETAPLAKEAIKYGIPTFILHGNLVHFAAYKSHLGFYPGTAPIKAFKAELTKYELSKGTIKFPLDKPVPISLIKKITRYCIHRNMENFILKQK